MFRYPWEACFFFLKGMEEEEKEEEDEEGEKEEGEGKERWIDLCERNGEREGTGWSGGKGVCG